jgi:hypothetical protein
VNYGEALKRLFELALVEQLRYGSHLATPISAASAELGI